MSVAEIILIVNHIGIATVLLIVLGVLIEKRGGERGIRTPGPFGSTVFKTAALDRSAISPRQK